MAQPKLQAQFFASASGVVTPKAPLLGEAQRHRIYTRDGGQCKKCSVSVRFGGAHSHPFQEIKSGAIDHIFARARGGRNDDNNLRLLCMSCNATKGAK